ncbi:MAG: DUF309 domain-containing protein [Candidatus Acidiferrales bacterium]
MTTSDDEKFERGVADFNAMRFFEAHEVWEELWLAAPEPEKTFLQGMIQVAAAFHHHGRGNARGRQSLLAAGIAKLAGCPDDFRGIAIAKLRDEVEAWRKLQQADMDRGPQDVPKIHSTKSTRRKRKRGG